LAENAHDQFGEMDLPFVASGDVSNDWMFGDYLPLSGDSWDLHKEVSSSVAPDFLQLHKSGDTVRHIDEDAHYDLNSDNFGVALSSQGVGSLVVVKVGGKPIKNVTEDGSVKLFSLHAKWRLDLRCPRGFGLCKDVIFELEEFDVPTGSWICAKACSRVTKQKPAEWLQELFGHRDDERGCACVTILAKKNGSVNPFPCTSFVHPNGLKLLRFKANCQGRVAVSWPYVVVGNDANAYDENAWTEERKKHLQNAVAALPRRILDDEQRATLPRGKRERSEDGYNCSTPDIAPERIVRHRVDEELDKLREVFVSLMRLGKSPEELRRFLDQIVANDPRGDIAYWVRKRNFEEKITAGQVVALVVASGGFHATLKPEDSDVVFAWTVVACAPGGPAPMVIGNPSGVADEEGVLVVYMGHVRVRCEPTVKACDVLCSNGSGIACSSGQENRLGVALGDASDGMVDAFVWIMRDNGVSTELASLGQSVAALQLRVGDLCAQVSEHKVRSRLDRVEARVAHLETSLGVMQAVVRMGSLSLADHGEQDEVLDAFLQGPVKRCYEAMRLKLFCQPKAAHLGLDHAVAVGDADLGFEVSCKWSEEHKCVLLEGEAGLGKTVQLQSWCVNHLAGRYQSGFYGDEVLLYVDLAPLVGLAEISLVQMLRCAFGVPDESPETLQLASALMRHKKNIIYCFDSYHLAEHVPWVKSLLACGKLPWVDRCILAVRPERQYLQNNNVNPVVRMTGLENGTHLNLMVDLVLGHAVEETTVTAMQHFL
jgi:hypothetical protein